MYANEGKEVLYWPYSERDVEPYLAEKVNVVSGEFLPQKFGSGYSMHVKLANVSVRTERGEWRSSLSVHLTRR